MFRTRTPYVILYSAWVHRSSVKDDRSLCTFSRSWESNFGSFRETSCRFVIELDKFHSLEQFLELLFVDVSSIRFFIFLYFVSSIRLSEPSLMSKFWKIGHFFSCLNAILTFSVIKRYFFGIFVIKHEKCIESNEFFLYKCKLKIRRFRVKLAE